MEDDPNQQPDPAFHQIQMRMSGQHQYPHSHHGTPATEFSGFVWPSPQATADVGAFGHNPAQRLNHQSLHPLVMPQWPSMLSSQSSQTPPSYYPTVVSSQAQSSTVSHTPLMTPISASSARSGSTPRRTLTDEERRKMCEYHEQNPSAKQNEIGSMFGVERSTVSKVLRQKEKYLQKQTEAVRSPERRMKGRSPDIEKTLSNWAIKEQKKGTVLSDEAIRDKAQYFSSVSGPDSSAPNPANNATWLKNFRRKHNITSHKSSKDSLATGNTGSTLQVKGSRRSPEEVSPMSSNRDSSPPSSSLRDVRSTESLKIETPEGFNDLTTTLSGNSLSAGFTETSSSSFSPNPLLSPSSPPFFTPDSATLPVGSFYRHSEMAAVPTLGSSNFHRPRSQTFPMIYQDVPTPDVSSDGTRFLGTNPLDDSMDDIGHSLDDIDEAMDDSPIADMDMESARPQTVNPTQMMHPPPLPASAIAARSNSQSGPSASCSDELRFEGTPATRTAYMSGEVPTQQEAREALKVVWKYFARQPQGADANLDMEETAMMGRYMEKLKARNRDRGSDNLL